MGSDSKVGSDSIGEAYGGYGGGFQPSDSEVAPARWLTTTFRPKLTITNFIFLHYINFEQWPL